MTRIIANSEYCDSEYLYYLPDFFESLPLAVRGTLIIKLERGALSHRMLQTVATLV